MRVLSAVDAGKPREEVARTFSVSMPTIKRWLKRRRETGDDRTLPLLPLTKWTKSSITKFAEFTFPYVG